MSKWRQGRRVGRTLYLQRGEEPSDDDELAQQAVDAVNRRARLAELEAERLRGGRP